MIKAISLSPGEKVLEIGPGSGIISIHCALEGCPVTAVDINPEAVKLTKENAKKCGVPERITTIKGDLFSPLAGEKFDVIIFNPPYLVSETQRDGIETAWDGGPYGREVTERFLSEAGVHLEFGGRIYILLEKQNRAEELMKRFAGFRWEAIAGANFFLLVVVVTMFAAMRFDSRLIWDTKE